MAKHTNTHTEQHTDIADEILTRPRGRVSEEHYKTAQDCPKYMSFIVEVSRCSNQQFFLQLCYNLFFNLAFPCHNFLVTESCLVLFFFTIFSLLKKTLVTQLFAQKIANFKTIFL